MARDEQSKWTKAKVKINGQEYTFEYKIIPGYYVLKSWGEQRFKNYKEMEKWFVEYVRNNR